LQDVFALFTATTIEFLTASRTLYHQNMTTSIPTIRMSVTTCPTDMAFCKNIIRDLFGKPRIKNKILTYEFGGKILRFNFLGIADNTASKLVDVLVTMVLDKCGSFFTTYSTCTIQ
jgi:hypothetical protein